MIGHCRGLQLLTYLIRSCYWSFVWRTLLWYLTFFLWKRFDILWCWWVVNDDLMFSWYCIFPFSELRNVVWCLIVEFFISSNFLYSLILLNKCCMEILFLWWIFGKIANLKLNCVESVICFECWMLSGLRSFFFKAMLKVVVWRTAC